MGLNRYLKLRQCFHVGTDEPIHCELYPAERSDSPVLIVLPGLVTYGELYAELLAGFSAQGYNTVALDYPGHGYSCGENGVYTVASVVKAVRQLINVLQERFSGPVYLYGYSIGSLLGVAAAEQDSRIEAVVCGTLLVPEVAPDFMHQVAWHWVSSSALFFPYLRVPLKTVVDYGQLIAGHPAEKELMEDPLCMYDYPLSTLASLYSWRSEVKRKTMDFRALILHGTTDEVLPLSYSRKLVAELTHPFDLQELPGGHMTPWVNPQLLVRQIHDWIHD